MNFQLTRRRKHVVAQLSPSSEYETISLAIWRASIKPIPRLARQGVPEDQTFFTIKYLRRTGMRLSEAYLVYSHQVVG